MISISRGLTDIGPLEVKNSKYVRWVNPRPEAPAVLRFNTGASDVATVDGHEFVTCEDGKLRSFVCCRDDRTCSLCEASHPITETGWAYVATGRLGSGRLFMPDGLGPSVLKLPTTAFWPLAAAKAAEHGTLRDRPYAIEKVAGAIAYSLEEAGEPFRTMPADPPWAATDLREVIEYFASGQFYARHLGGVS
jgi:hypothetical protein